MDGNKASDLAIMKKDSGDFDEAGFWNIFPMVEIWV